MPVKDLVPVEEAGPQVFDSKVRMPQSLQSGQFDFTVEAEVAAGDEEAIVSGLVWKSTEAFHQSLQAAKPMPALP